jgi:hypothetical protein
MPRTELSALALAVSPSGNPYVRAAEDGDDALDGPRVAPIAAAFDRGAGAGVFHLGAVEVGTALPAPFAYFRSIGHDILTRLCARADLEDARERVDVEPDSERLQAMERASRP